AALGDPTRAPTFMRLTVAPDQPRIEGAGLDFRDEIMAQIYDRGDAWPKRTLTFNIDVTDDGETHGPSFRERRTFRNWRPIGTLTFDRAGVSYNGDFVIHFRHPTWRDDQNDPATATRVNGRKVRRHRDMVTSARGIVMTRQSVGRRRPGLAGAEELNPPRAKSKRASRPGPSQVRAGT